MNYDYWYTVLFISTLIGFIGGFIVAIGIVVLAFIEDFRLLLWLPIPLAIFSASLAWGVLYG